MAVLTRVVLCVVALMLTAACRAGQEQWGPFRGQVVDFDTGDPIARAHVMALWIREPPSLHYQQWVYDARETVTDADGRFEIPYERRWITAWVNPPRIDVFAPTYQMGGVSTAPEEGRPFVDATTIRMRPLKTRAEECQFRVYGPSLDAQLKIPRYVEALQRYTANLNCE